MVTNTVHQLRSSPQYFQAIVEGRKKAEVRRTDRHFLVGDILELTEHDPRTRIPTGRSAHVTVTHVISEDEPCDLSPEALAPGFCILSIELEDGAAIAQPVAFAQARRTGSGGAA
jgi:hypothetical protein